MKFIPLLALSLTTSSISNAFAFQLEQHTFSSRPSSIVLSAATGTMDLTSSIQSNLDTLYRAAETKKEDSNAVYQALSDLEKNMRQLAKQDEAVAKNMLAQLDGDWRLVFTTGTAKTQEQMGKINYFPLKAVQSFRPAENYIENGIYIGDFCLVRFSGNMEFDERKRRIEFDFDTIYFLNSLVTIPLKKGQAADLGSKSGLGSDSNVKNAERNKKPFFNWISADEKIATARGGGGGLALWKRV
ncbi:hypothetical protein MPSEU_000269000 [Mayamaea pseudoterrestris]|nr:hypothetical protein MPSEU_000269000 [Mayamaea pseudoterrestris]